MNKSKCILLGLVVGAIAYVIKVIAWVKISAYLPKHPKITHEMTEAEIEKITITIQFFSIFEHLVAASVMAIIVYFLVSICKIKTSALFVITSISTLLCIYFFNVINSFGSDVFTWVFIPGILLSCIMLGFSLVAPNMFKNENAANGSDAS